ncbi:S8 family serine peptidase [Desulfoscipio gibsoniae]|uniref:Subtilisin-like serine protease n=1 Tax=Desulfoscipio gibsoniae DSM 7213 TaxID=767817 RepID=R4KQI7_9FIRM|nr:S8 family serine peptidase [Desulfoscipio gibsoniae]AGL03807.1 subtilisin-like serine protease [Desulfoscipio gibsoniae DSM 7213]
MHIKKRWSLILAFFVVAISIWTWQSADSQDKNSRRGDRTENRDINEAGDRDKNLAMFALELNRSLTGAEEAELKDRVDWLGRLDGKTLLVRAGTEQRQALQKLPYIKNLAPYLPEQKIPADLGNPPDDTRGENAKAASTPDSTPVVVTVTLAESGDKASVKKLIESLEGRVLDGAGGEGRYLRVELPASAVDQLAGSPRVLYIEKYNQPELLNDRARDIVGARPLAIPKFVTGTGLTGEGQTIGLADSGLDTGSMGNLHPDLESAAGEKPRVIMLKSWAGVETPADVSGHGTHMAGTLVGSGKASDGKYTGVAPGASLYFQGIVDEDENTAPPLDLRELFEPAYNANVRIHINGWGKKQNTYVSTTAQVDEYVRSRPDFLVIFGAGNSGAREGSITAEANSKNALVVGASISPRPAFENNIGDSGDVASFSSRGPTGDGRIKPELVAPGTSVISPASRLVKGNLAGRPDYTVKQGTSMATAVTGGAAALLRQYFKEYGGNADPSAALMKATLINGARRLEQEPAAAGFGLLDIGSTIMALQNGLYEAVDDNTGLTGGDNITYEKEITHPGAPLKATLSWTDPAAAPGARSALVNDLDLEVIGPDGKKYYGNDFDYKGARDTSNNVEQVYIPDPAPGTYKIIVRGSSIQQDASPAKGVNQDYALVYGQPLARETITGSDQGMVTLTGEKQLALPENTTAAVDDRLLSPNDNLPAGAELYLMGLPDKPERAYAVGRTWQASGVKTLVEDSRTILVRINQEYREGGYAIDAGAKNVLSIGGYTLGEGQVIPPGAGVTAGINPRTQTLWHADITGREITGVLTGVDRDNRRLKLLDKQEDYVLAEEAVISFSDVMVDGDTADLPFGASTTAELEKLLSGMPVQITLGSDGKIYHLAVNRHIAVGRVVSVQLASRTINLSSGGSYHIMPGINLDRDQKSIGLEDIKEGELAILDLVPNSTEVLNLAVYSDVSYGRVIYAEKDTLYLMDNAQGFINLRIEPESQVFRWGMAAGTSILTPGQWVRVITDPVSREVWRVDVAEAADKIATNLEKYVPGSGIRIAGGEVYRLSDVSVVTKNNWPVQPRDLVPGEPVKVTPLYGPAGEQIVATLEAQTRQGIKPPELTILSTIPFEDFSLISGHTTASRLYSVYPGGIRQEVEISNSGDFYYPVKAGEAENISLVAVDRDTGGVTGLQLSLPRLQKGFSDIDGHWAEVDIRQLVSRGMLKGYPDGSFKPDQAVNRVEFTALVTRLIGGDGSTTKLPFKDAEVIPRWARSAVALAYSRNLAMGYEDNTFRPYERITREEAAVLLVRIYDTINGVPEGLPAPLPYNDQGGISAWALEDVRKVRTLGLLSGKPGNLFTPKDYITRAETAAALNHLLYKITRENKEGQ